MKYNVKALLDTYGVEYVTEGPNVKAGHLNVKCPWCGHADPSHHMGIRLDGSAYGCWRSSDHRGYKPHRLLSRLLGMSYRQIDALLKERVRPDESIADLRVRCVQVWASQGSGESSGATIPPPVKFPPGARKIVREGPTLGAWNYLHRRGFRRKDVDLLCRRYNLRAGISGKWDNRILFPFVYGKKLRGWTARDMSRRARIKYLSEPEGDAAKSMLLNFDRAAKGGKVLAVTEGPLDAYKVDFYVPDTRAVALLGLSITASQLTQLLELADRFQRVVLLTDADAVAATIRLKSELAVVDPVVRRLPEGVEDPGALSFRQARSLVL